MLKAFEQPQLWCVHVIGPDDVYAAPDIQTACRWANILNDTSRLLNADCSADDFVLCHANVAIWPYSVESHAEDVPKSIIDFTPRGQLPVGSM